MRRVACFIAWSVFASCVFASGLLSSTALAGDPAERFIREATARAEYWKARGYVFDARVLGADSMDRKVHDVQRAEYWKERGFQFDPQKVSAWAMDRKAENLLRVEYWKRWGIEFDADLMDAETMDKVAVKLQAVRELLAKRSAGQAVIVLSDVLGARPDLANLDNVLKPRLDAGRPSPLALAAPLALGTVNRSANRGRRGGAGGRGLGGGTSLSLPQGSSRATRGVRRPGKIDLEQIDPEEFARFLNRIAN